ncbi:MAG: PEGA domain-containing protein [Myxococcota bacterium]
MRWVSAILVALYVNLLIAPDVLAAKSSASKKSSKSKTSEKTLLEVMGSVAGATVLFDDQVLGETPLKNKVVPAKTGTVTVRKLGFLEFKQKVTVKAGDTTKVTADLLPFAGVIHVTSNVSHAQVSVDGKVVGSVPLDYEVKIGTRQITVSVAGYPPFQQTVRANPGETYDMRAAFGNKPGQIAALPLEVDGSAPPFHGGKHDNLALVPLEAPPREPSLELPLEPVLQPSLVPSLLPPGGVGTGGTGELALEGLTSGDPMEPGLAPLTLNARMGRPKPWYKEWWAITGAGALAVVGVVAIVLIAKGGGGPEEIPPDVSWQPNPLD